MTIKEHSTGISRNLIGYFGADPDPCLVKEIELRNYKSIILNKKSILTDNVLATLDSVIFFSYGTGELSRKIKSIKDFLTKYGENLLNHDCDIYIYIEMDKEGREYVTLRKYIINIINDLQLPPSGLNAIEWNLIGDWYEGQNPSTLSPYVHIIETLESPTKWGDIANTIRNNASEHSINDLLRWTINLDLKIELENNLKLEDGDKLLLMRAFWDCYSVHLHKITNGLSGVDTYKAYVHVARNRTGSEHAYNFFIKIGKRNKIAGEYRKYLDHALKYIPFHLGPRVNKERCVLGKSNGILVCDYVSDAETLRDCAKDGRATAAISNLFNTTIYAWHRNATTEDVILKNFLYKKLYKQIPAHRAPLIDQMGSKHHQDELWDMLETHTEQVNIGVVHGDLHATNVLVRSNDAIIIDFANVEEGYPIALDPASIEAGLLVDGFLDDARTDEQILNSIECLYTIDAFNVCSPKPSTGDRSEWFFNCVRQIRMHAKDITLNQKHYAVTLAMVLLKKGCNPDNFGEKGSGIKYGARRENMRAIAYILGERLLVSMSS